ncbi:hypothetical protein DSCA_47450 [Desulfosarcina alkanivorans]|uniref:DUF4154 domain-containing protein n=2 Tax=Desulfosarcina alkanivorans TaxID=571177 RepID=A0A5K7YR75_9BACT|nr:hypothetical protein DSCA_47450 [Desulfosarcina alkanivorans]
MQGRPHKIKRCSRICRFCTILVLLGLCLPRMGAAGAPSLKADSVKAAFVLNFARYTQWPDHSFSSPTAPIELMVIGGDATHQAFAAINGKVIGSRKLRLRFMKTAEVADSCHMMFISRDVDRSMLSGALAAAANRPILTVGDIPNFIRDGGIINIFNKNNRFHFEIQPEAARRQGLKLSSRLLKLAIIVGD